MPNCNGHRYQQHVFLYTWVKWSAKQKVKDMTIDTFTNMNIYQRADAVSKSTPIASREFNDQLIMLFSLSDFFIEVTYDIRQEYICAIHAFKAINLLTPYLEVIDISEIRP
jgi:hypothetical protein